MTRQLLTVFKYIIFLGIGIGLLFLALRNIDFARMIDGFKKANYGWVVVVFLMMIIVNYSRAYRWRMLIQPLGYKPNINNVFSAVMAGYLANLALPRMGEVTRCGALNQTDNIPVETLIGTVIVERTLDVIMLSLSICLTALLEYKLLGGFIYINIAKPLAEKLLLLLSSPISLFIGISLVVICIVIFIIIYKNRQRIPLFNKIVQLLIGIANGMSTVFKMENKLLFVGHTFFIWSMYFVIGYIGFLAIPATAHLGIQAALFSFVLGGIGMAAPVQGGVGVYHLLVSQGLMLFGISAADGILFATFSHAMQTLAMIVLGTIGFWVIFMAKKKNESLTNHSG